MNLAKDLDFFLAQGPVFWAAAAAVGLGGALLASAMFVWMRRRVGALRPSFALPSLRRRHSRPVAETRISVDETGYSVAGAPRALAPRIHPATDLRQLEALLDRLREAGDRLETALEGGSSKDLLQRELKTARKRDEIESSVGAC